MLNRPTWLLDLFNRCQNHHALSQGKAKPRYDIAAELPGATALTSMSANMGMIESGHEEESRSSLQDASVYAIPD